MPTVSHQANNNLALTFAALQDDIWRAGRDHLPRVFLSEHRERALDLSQRFVKLVANGWESLPLDVQLNVIINGQALVMLQERTGAARSKQGKDLYSQLLGIIDSINKDHARIFEPLRIQLLNGALKQEELRSLLVSRIRPANGPTLGWHLEQADFFVDMLLQVPQVSMERGARHENMHHYQPTGVATVLELCDLLRLDQSDVFCDLGSGYCRIPILISLLTGTRSIGVEYCAGLHHVACDTIERNRIMRVEPIQADARMFDYSRANIFYMFNPFRGEILEDVMRKLIERMEQGVSNGQRVLVASLGTSSDKFRERFGELIVDLDQSQRNSYYNLKVFKHINAP